jgi:hypothetical protein
MPIGGGIIPIFGSGGIDAVSTLNAVLADEINKSNNVSKKPVINDIMVLYIDTDVKCHLEIFEMMKIHPEYAGLEKIIKDKEYSFITIQQKEEAGRIETKRKVDIQFMRNYIKRFPDEASKYIEVLKELPQDETK